MPSLPGAPAIGVRQMCGVKLVACEEQGMEMHFNESNSSSQPITSPIEPKRATAKINAVDFGAA